VIKAHWRTTRGPGLRIIYGRFTEGFDPKDPKEAKALLDELA
jgi:hypothetical protein